MHSATSSTLDRSLIQPAPSPCLFHGCKLLLWHTGEHARSDKDARYGHRVEIRDGGRRVVHWNVKDKDSKRCAGHVEPGQHAEIAQRSWIRVFGTCDGKAVDRVFGIGDEAAYDGYNLIYTGRIEAIGPNTVTIRDGHVRRISIYEFVFWNKRFDMAAIRAANHETFQCI